MYQNENEMRPPLTLHARPSTASSSGLPPQHAPPRAQNRVSRDQRKPATMTTAIGTRRGDRLISSSPGAGKTSTLPPRTCRGRQILTPPSCSIICRQCASQPTTRGTAKSTGKKSSGKHADGARAEARRRSRVSSCPRTQSTQQTHPSRGR